MATPFKQLLSRTLYYTDGTTTVWDFSFAGGYLDVAHIKAYTETPAGMRVDQTISLTGPNQVTISPALADGDILVIYRDTPKNAPLVDFTDESGFSEIALDTNAKQAVFIAAETTDTVNTYSSYDAEQAASLAAIAAAAAQASANAAAASALLAANEADASAASAVLSAASAVNSANSAASSSAAATTVFNANTTAYTRTLLDDATAVAARATLGAAASGANADITSLTGLTTPLSAAQGGTGMANGFVSSLITNGYQKLPSGLILQWGSVTTNASGDATVTFPIAFPTAGLNMVASFYNSTKIDVTITVGLLTTTTSYIGLLAGGSGSAGVVFYLAIGY